MNRIRISIADDRQPFSSQMNKTRQTIALVLPWTVPAGIDKARFRYGCLCGTDA
jgi:hypothetical protein